MFVKKLKRTLHIFIKEQLKKHYKFNEIQAVEIISLISSFDFPARLYAAI